MSMENNIQAYFLSEEILLITVWIYVNIMQ